MLFNGKKFAERLLNLIYASGKCLSEIPDAIGVNRNVFFYFLIDKEVPDFQTIVKLAEFFNCSVDFLLGLSASNDEKKYCACIPFSIRYRLLLSRYGVTKYKIHKEVGIPEDVQRDWQTGQREPSVETAIRLAHYFDLALDEMLGRI